MEIFTGVSLLEFVDRFKTEEDCKEYLAYHKWRDGFTCYECGHTEYWVGQKPFTRVCKSCRKIESATANTHFGKVKFGLRKAFMAVFEMTTTTKSVSANQMSKRVSSKHKVLWLFMQKIRNVMASSCKYRLTGDVIVDEIVIGGYEEGAVGRKTETEKKMKVLVAIEVTSKGIKRGYAIIIDNYSANELRKIFEKHIDRSASILTDKWSGYKPIAREYNIRQEKSVGGKNFVLMNRYAQGLKSWLRGIHHHVDPYHLQSYLDEYCYRFNRHISKASIFDETIERMVKYGSITKKDISKPHDENERRKKLVRHEMIDKKVA